MGEDSSIEWTDHTWNPWLGCIKVSRGCKHCYAERETDRRQGAGAFRKVRRAKTTWSMPRRWNKAADRAGKPALVFTCSFSDFFIEEADEWRAEAWELIRSTPWLTYQILTKRPERIRDALPPDWGEGYPNVWLGVSIEDEDALGRLPILMKIPAASRFLSIEPLLGPIGPDLFNWQDYCGGEEPEYCHCFDGWPVTMREPAEAGYDYDWPDWVVVGGESGPTPRPMDIAWARQVRDQCVTAGVAFFFKQHGGRTRINGTWGGRDLDGRTWDEIPEPHIPPRPPRQATLGGA